MRLTLLVLQFILEQCTHKHHLSGDKIHLQNSSLPEFKDESYPSRAYFTGKRRWLSIRTDARQVNLVSQKQLCTSNYESIQLEE
jgi:hypothetical protein